MSPGAARTGVKLAIVPAVGDQLRTATIALLVGTALLSGCSQRQEASTTLPAQSAAPTTSAEALPPLGPPDLPMPTEARAKTPEGAEAFLRYYIELYNDSLNSLDSTYLRDLSASCETCNLLVNQVDHVGAQGQRYEGGEVRVDSISMGPVVGSEVQFAFSLTQAALSVTLEGIPIEGRNYPVRSSPGSGGILLWDDVRLTWLMNQLDIQ